MHRYCPRLIHQKPLKAFRRSDVEHHSKTRDTKPEDPSQKRSSACRERDETANGENGEHRSSPESMDTPNGRDDPPAGRDSANEKSGIPEVVSTAYNRRQTLRQRPQSSSTTTQPRSRIPHASTGQTAHSRRGGFPGVQILIWRALKIAFKPFPKLADSLTAFVRKHHSEASFDSLHPLSGLSETLKNTVGDHADAK